MHTPYFYMKNFFQREECDYILEKYRKDISFAGLGHDAQSDNDSRRSKVALINNDPILSSKLCEAFNIANINNFNVNIDLPYGLNGIQITEYDESYKGMYNTHIDSWLFTGEESVSHERFLDRKLSMTVLLEDDNKYEGGDFMLQSLTNDKWLVIPELKEKGNLIVFPSILPHKVTPVTKGTRYSLVSWVSGQHWK